MGRRIHRSRFGFAGLVAVWIGPWFPVATLAAGSAPADEARAEAAGPELPLDRGIHQRVANFTLKDVLTKKDVSLYNFMGKKAVVIVFLGNDCPIGNVYVPRLIELNRKYHDRGVVFLGINSNAHEALEDVARYVRDNKIDFPVLKDPRNAVSDTLLVERACASFVLDGFARMRYRGAIDDQYVPGKRKSAPGRSYLSEAIEAVLANRPLATPATRVAGCLLDRIEPPRADRASAPRIRAPRPEVAAALAARDRENPVEVGKVTYARDVSRIVQNKCQTCHRPGQVGPFSLLTYDDARKHAAMIHEVVDERRMPPWHADPRYGHFSNDRSLTGPERAALLAWVDQGAPLGDPTDLPPARSYPEGWSIGTPDVVFEMPEPYYVPAQGVVAYVYFVVPTNFQEDRWVQAAEAVPGDPSVVHHIVAYLRSPEQKNERGLGPGEHFCGYAPGDLPTVLPEGSAKKVPAGSSLVLQVHYTPNGRVRSDRSKVGFIFAKTPPKRRAQTIGIANPDLMVPPGRDNVAVSSAIVLPREVRLLAFMPHMHLRGKNFKYTVTVPGEEPRTLLSVPDYDFGWQTYYHLKEPAILPRGARIDCLAHFDNSANNPYNPDPKAFVRWGEQTFEEMMIGYVDIDQPVDAPPLGGSDLRPGSIRATQSALRTFRRLAAGRGMPPTAPAKAKTPSAPPSAPVEAKKPSAP